MGQSLVCNRSTHRNHPQQGPEPQQQGQSDQRARTRGLTPAQPRQSRLERINPQQDIGPEDTLKKK